MACETNIIVAQEVFIGTPRNATALPRPPFQMGDIDSYSLSDNQIVTREEGVLLAKEGKIKGVGIAHNKNTEYLKSIPDGKEGNNLSSLPTVDKFS